MPRTGRGGARSGTPGKSYGNRTDLNTATQPVRVAPSQQYGQGVQQEAAQQAMPLPNNTGMPAAAPAPQAPPVAPAVPGELGPLDRPTSRPGEHVSTGLPMGGGAGPEAMMSGPSDDVGLRLRALYQAFPNQDLRDLIAAHDENMDLFGG